MCGWAEVLHMHVSTRSMQTPCTRAHSVCTLAGTVSAHCARTRAHARAACLVDMLQLMHTLRGLVRHGGFETHLAQAAQPTTATVAQDTVPDGIPCRLRNCAGWDTVPHGIPCRVGYRAAWDTVPSAIPCRLRYRAGWDERTCEWSDGSGRPSGPSRLRMMAALPRRYSRVPSRAEHYGNRAPACADRSFNTAPAPLVAQACTACTAEPAHAQWRS
jgi:hypothetical protein